MGRILAVDLGEKRVGLALTDPLKVIASPYKVIAFHGLKQLAAELKLLVKEKNVETIVIGYPVHEDGTAGSGCAAAEYLHTLLSRAELRAILWDERYTSKMAEDVLHNSGIMAKKMKGRIDKIAASLLLENYLRFLEK